MKFNRHYLPAICLVLFSMLIAPTLGCSGKGGGTGADGPDVHIEGTWSGTAQQTGSSNPTFTLKLNQRKDGEVWGTISSKDGTFNEAIISGGKVMGSKLSFSATANGTNLRSGRSFTFDAEIQDGKMDGVWKDILDRSWGPFVLDRQSESAEGSVPAPSKDTH
ncbi:MAG: hypothetical protein R3231_12515 [bacterium]|nr:hypothetical protein [bacterium]